MKTKNNVIILLSSIICLLPLILSAVVYNDLPEQIALQLGTGGAPQNFVPRAFAAFGIPFLFAVLNIISKVRLLNDPKKANASRMTQIFMLWFIPVLSLIIVPVALFRAMGVMIPILMLAPLLIGIVLILYGNYLPKNRQNYVIGYRTPWTLNNADNWSKTHRLAGRLWVIGGIIMIVQAFVLFESAVWLILLGSIITLVIVIPPIYSYALYAKKSDNTQNTDENITE